MVGCLQASAASERERALAALCWAQEEVLRSMTLDMTLSSDIRSQDINTVILGVARRSREGLQAAWDFYRRCTLRDCSIEPKAMLHLPQSMPEYQVQYLLFSKSTPSIKVLGRSLDLQFCETVKTMVLAKLSRKAGRAHQVTAGQTSRWIRLPSKM